MTLKDFVSESLLEILTGVAEAQKKDGKIGGRVDTIGKSDAACRLRDGQTGFLVNFDVAVTASEKASKDLGGGIQVAGFLKAGANSAATNEQSVITRIQFSVPIIFRTDAEGFAQSHEFLAQLPPTKPLNT